MRRKLNINRLHRRLGVITCIFILILSITGILLNHSIDFGLHHITLESDFWYNLYELDKNITDENGYPIHIITLEKVIIDIHNGKILGNIGKYILDSIAILLIIISITGFYLWRKRAKNNRNN